MVKKNKVQVVETVMSAVAQPANQIPEPFKKPRVKKERTLEQIEADKERMAKLRAMRKTSAAKASK